MTSVDGEGKLFRSSSLRQSILDGKLLALQSFVCLEFNIFQARKNSSLKNEKNLIKARISEEKSRRPCVILKKFQISLELICNLENA